MSDTADFQALCQALGQTIRPAKFRIIAGIGNEALGCITSVLPLTDKEIHLFGDWQSIPERAPAIHYHAFEKTRGLFKQAGTTFDAILVPDWLNTLPVKTAQKWTQKWWNLLRPKGMLAMVNESETRSAPHAKTFHEMALLVNRLDNKSLVQLKKDPSGHFYCLKVWKK